MTKHLKRRSNLWGKSFFLAKESTEYVEVKTIALISYGDLFSNIIKLRYILACFI